MPDSIVKFFDIDQRPPRNGWGLSIGGHRIEGHSEKEIFEAIKRWRKNNGTFVSDIDVTREMWDIYREREPDRSTQQSYPSTRRVVANAAGAAVRVAKAIVKGEKVRVPLTTQEKRLSICQACPQRDPIRERCYVCGCYLSRKTKLETERCPIGKW